MELALCYITCIKIVGKKKKMENKNQTHIVEITGEVELIYDENSTEFKNALEGYKELIDERGTKERMLTHVAFCVMKFGISNLVEGVGYVGCGGILPNEKPYSGIMVSTGYDEFAFDLVEPI